MRIISKHKDYFDHLVSYYGFDSLIVWDRRNTGNFKAPASWMNYSLFSICGEYVPVIHKNGKFIFDPKDKNLDNWDKNFIEIWENKKSAINVKYRQPVLVQSHFKDSVGIPILKEFGFASQYDPHEMYQKIYAFLSWLKDNPEPPNNQTNKEKIIAHGFDARTSFRPTIKK